MSARRRGRSAAAAARAAVARPTAAPDVGRRRGRGSRPGVVFLAVALIGSVVFGLYAITVRDASQIPLLAAGAVALGIVFIALAVYSLRATWRAGVAGGTDGRSRSAAAAGSRSRSGPAASRARSSCSCCHGRPA